MSDTALSIGCRRSIEIAARLGDWLEGSSALRPEVRPVIAGSVARASLDLRRIMRSIDAVPCLGLVGGAARDRAGLVVEALVQDDVTSIGELGPDTASTARQISRLVGSDPGIAIRFRHGTGRRSGGSSVGDRQVIELELFSVFDIVKIIIGAYYVHVPGAAQKRFDETAIKQALADAEQDLSPAVIAGISGDDIVNLRQYLWARFPMVEAARALSASGYWDWLIRHVAHLSIEGRCSLLAHLWHNEPGLTALFRRLSEALREIGYAASVRVGQDALFVAERAGRQLTSAHSIIHRLTPVGLLGATQLAAPVGISLGQGTQRNVERTVIAALAHTMNLHVNRAHPLSLETTDVKVFPSSPPLVDFAPCLGHDHHASPEISEASIEQLFIRAKTAFLLARAAMGNELSGIVLLADGDSAVDDGAMEMVSEWVERTGGDDPATRERMDVGLAIIVRSDEVKPAEGRSGRNAGNERLKQFVGELVGEDNRWAREWMPGRAFSKIHYVNSFANPARAIDGDGPSAGHEETDGGVVRRLNEGVFPVRAPVSWPRMPATDALLDIAANASQVVRARQIRRQLAGAQKSIQARIFRYHHDTPGRFDDWRRQIANVASKRLEVLSERHELADVLAALSLRAGEARLVLNGLKSGAVSQPGAGSGLARTDRAPALLPGSDDCASAIVSQWFRLMHEAADSDQLSRAFDLPKPVFQHIIDEIIVCAQRTGLVGLIASRFQRTLDGGELMIDLGENFARVAELAVGAFLERLDAGPQPDRTGESQSARPGAGGRHAGPPGARFSAPSADDTVSTREDHHVDSWPRRFRDMVDANLFAAQALAGTGEADHELGEYLSMLASNPLEVEL